MAVRRSPVCERASSRTMALHDLYNVGTIGFCEATVPADCDCDGAAVAVAVAVAATNSRATDPQTHLPML